MDRPVRATLLGPMIERLFIGRQTLVWAGLIVVTAISWALGHEIGSPELANAIIVVLSFLKVRFVIRDFMEVREAPLWLRLVIDVWVVAAPIILIGLMLHRF